MVQVEIKTRISIVAVILIAIGLFLGVRTYLFVSRAQRAVGHVLRVGSISDYRTKLFPAEISFQDQAGVAYTMHIGIKARAGMLRQGQTVEVLYISADPQATAQVNIPTRIWVWPVVFLFPGLLFLALRDPIARNSRCQI